MRLAMLAYKTQPVFYPESDGKPMAETDTHRNLLFKMVDMLQNAFPEAYVSGNICLYYEKGNPKKMISPDSLLCRSQKREQKRVYLAWEENAQLDMVVEHSSYSTKKEDHHKKKQIYERILKVPYYVIFDPHVIYLYVFELIDGKYQFVEANETGHYFMSDLNISIAIENSNELRLFDSAGNPIPTSSEKQAQRAELEAQRADKLQSQLEEEKRKAEEEKQELLAELERLRKLSLA